MRKENSRQEGARNLEEWVPFPNPRSSNYHHSKNTELSEGKWKNKHKMAFVHKNGEISELDLLGKLP